MEKDDRNRGWYVLIVAFHLFFTLFFLTKQKSIFYLENLCWQHDWCAHVEETEVGRMLGGVGKD